MTTPEQLVLISEPRVRHDNPDTSRDAASSITGGVENDILSVFEWGKAMGLVTALTDDEICGQFPTRHAPTLKTARSRLTKRGLLVADGVRRNSRGRDMTVWRLA